MRLKRLFLGVMLLVGITGAGATNAAPEDISASISLKVPGNDAKTVIPSTLQKPVYPMEVSPDKITSPSL